MARDYDEYRQLFELTGHSEACLSDATVPDLHLHEYRGRCSITVYRGYRGLFLGDSQVAVFSTGSLAARCLELLERHGFADVPDLLPSWPPPDPSTLLYPATRDEPAPPPAPRTES